MSDLNLTDWLAGATVAESAVEIYQNAALLGRIEEWEGRYARAESADDSESVLGEASQTQALEAEGRGLLAELEASKSVWYMRALSSQDGLAIEGAHPLPERPARFEEKPPFLQARPTEAQARAFIKAMEAWEARREAFAEAHRADAEEYVAAATKALVARGAEKIVRSLSRIEVGGEVIAESIAIDQARSLGERIGEAQLGKILGSIEAATNAEPSMPAPFSRASSEETPV